MITPIYTQIPDFTKFINKDYVLLEDFYLPNKTGKFNSFCCKGMKFRITNIENNGMVKCIIVSKVEEIEESINFFVKNTIELNIKRLSDIEASLKLWETESENLTMVTNNLFEHNKKMNCPFNKSYYWNSIDLLNEIKKSDLTDLEKYTKLSTSTKNKIYKEWFKNPSHDFGGGWYIHLNVLNTIKFQQL